MTPKFLPTNKDQQLLFPPSIQDWLPEEHLARFVVDIVSQLNLQPLAEPYEGKGFKAYHPEILLSLLFYGYATGVFSSSKIEQATYDCVAFSFISANTHPEHTEHCASSNRIGHNLVAALLQCQFFEGNFKKSRAFVL